jgi:hypothetical protein
MIFLKLESNTLIALNIKIVEIIFKASEFFREEQIIQKSFTQSAELDFKWRCFIKIVSIF